MRGSRKDSPDATAHSFVETSRRVRGGDTREPYSPSTHAITCISCGKRTPQQTGKPGTPLRDRQTKLSRQDHPYATCKPRGYAKKNTRHEHQKIEKHPCTHRQTHNRLRTLTRRQHQTTKHAHKLQAKRYRVGVVGKLIHNREHQKQVRSIRPFDGCYDTASTFRRKRVLNDGAS